MMFPIIQLGPLAVQAPGLFWLLGIWVGLYVAERAAPRLGANPNHLYNTAFVALLAGLIGARLSYALQNLPAFAPSPLNLFSLNPGLLDPLGGAATALIALLIYTQRQQIALWPLLDALAPLGAVFWMAFGMANLASGQAFGMETSLPWAIPLWGAMRHPVQIYQVLAGALILGCIWPRGGKSAPTSRGGGETFWRFLTLSAAAWLLIEAFRGDSILWPGGIRASQVASWLVLALGLWGWGQAQKSRPAPAG